MGVFVGTWMFVLGCVFATCQMQNADPMHFGSDYINGSFAITSTMSEFPMYSSERDEPFFVPSYSPNVTAMIGKTALLNCSVGRLGNKSVSWVRHRDIHILTNGLAVYTSDQRFLPTHQTDSDDWTLQIRWVTKADAGIYECQISTQPIKSSVFYLNVVVPAAKIYGGPDLHFGRGSTINLTCLVKHSSEPPAYIFWFHNDETISYDSSRGGVTIITDKGESTICYLLIQDAKPSDSGKYSCNPSNADAASVRVHVLNGERPEAMQTGSSTHAVSWFQLLIFSAVPLLYNEYVTP